jgi:chromosomal replication initiator protein
MVSQDKNILWERCLAIFRDNLTEEQFNAWFMPLSVYSYEDNKLVLNVPSQYFVERIERTYLNLVKKTLRHIYGDKIQLYYNDSSTTIKGATSSPVIENRVEKSMPKIVSPFQKEDYGEIDSQLNPKYNFENYCGGMCNKLAVTIGEKIATDPLCRTFSPLFIFGATGVGKTHLIQAIGIKMKESQPRSRVLYVTARIFESQYTTAVRNNKVNDFINFYQSIDTLILDDIQELAGKTATQNTFYHIFNHLHQNQKQLILSSDTRPVDMDGMVPRLISRFKWGMTVELNKPDFSLRRNVLTMKAEQDGLVISNEILDYIANNVTDSVRELEGVIVSLLGHAAMLNQDITLDLAKAVVANAVKISKTQLTFEIIAEKVCEHYNIDTDLIYAKSRKREISDARQVVMYLVKKHTQLSSTNIGLRLSRNHATVLHACKNIEERLSVDKQLQEDLETIENGFKG